MRELKTKSRQFLERGEVMEQITVEVKLTANPNMIRKVLSLLSQLRYNGSIGHSGYWYISCDGDGPDRLKFEPNELYNPYDKFGANEIPTSCMERVFELQRLKEARKK